MHAWGLCMAGVRVGSSEQERASEQARVGRSIGSGWLAGGRSLLVKDVATGGLADVRQAGVGAIAVLAACIPRAGEQFISCMVQMIMQFCPRTHEQRARVLHTRGAQSCEGGDRSASMPACMHDEAQLRLSRFEAPTHLVVMLGRGCPRALRHRTRSAAQRRGRGCMDVRGCVRAHLCQSPAVSLQGTLLAQSVGMHGSSGLQRKLSHLSCRLLGRAARAAHNQTWAVGYVGGQAADKQRT